MINPPAPTITFGGKAIPAVGPTVVPTVNNNANAIATAASRAIPPVTPPPAPNVTVIPPQQVLQYLTYVIPAGGAQRIDVSGDYFYIDTTVFNGINSLATSPLYFKTDTSPALTPIVATRIGVDFPADFKWVEISNPTLGVAVTLTLWIGHGYVEDNRGRTQIVSQAAGLVQAVVVRPNNVTPYAANQAVSSNPGTVQSFVDALQASFTPFSGLTSSAGAPGLMSIIRSAKLIKNSTTTANAYFRLWLQNQLAAPAAVNDQAAWPLLFANLTAQQPFIDFPTFITAGAGSTAAVCEITGLAIPITTALGSIGLFMQLTAQAAYVPVANENFEILLGIEWVI